MQAQLRPATCALEKLQVIFVWNDGIVRGVTANVTLPAPAPDKVLRKQTTAL